MRTKINKIIFENTHRAIARFFFTPRDLSKGERLFPRSSTAQQGSRCLKAGPQNFISFIKLSVKPFVLSFLAAFILTALSCAYPSGACQALPRTDNSRTCEVKLNYSVIREIETAAAEITGGAASGPTSNEGGGALFTIKRNQTLLRDFIAAPGLILACGNFGAKLISDGGSMPDAGLLKFGKIIGALSAKNFFGAIVNTACLVENSLYLGTSGGDIIEADENSARLISIIRSKGRFSINKIKKYGGALYIMTEGGGLYIYNKNRIYCVSYESHGLISNNIRCVEFLRAAGFEFAAVGTDAGLSILKINDTAKNDLDTVFSYRTPSAVETAAVFREHFYFGGVFGLSTASVNYPGTCEVASVIKNIYVASVESAAGQLIIATKASGVYSLDGAAAEPVKTISASAFNNIYMKQARISRVRSAGETLYFMHENGIFKYYNKLASDIPVAKTGFSDKISCVAPVGRTIFFGTFDSGVFMEQDGRLSGIETTGPQKGSSGHINSLAELNGSLLIGTSGGLDIYDPMSRTLTAPSGPLANAHINCIHISGARAFIGTSDGMAVMRAGQSPEIIKLNPEIIDRHVYSIYHDEAAGRIYFGTYRGFGEMAYPGGSLKVHLMINSDIADNWVTAVVPFADKLIIGTYDKGICLFDKKTGKFEKAPGRNLLPSRMVNANAVTVIKDHIFIGTYNGGMSVIKTGGSFARWTARHFNQRSGFSGDMVTAIKLCGSEIVFGTFSGISSIAAGSIDLLFR